MSRSPPPSQGPVPDQMAMGGGEELSASKRPYSRSLAVVKLFPFEPCHAEHRAGQARTAKVPSIFNSSKQRNSHKDSNSTDLGISYPLLFL